MSRLHRRILDYAEPKRQWGYGQIEMKRRKCKQRCKMMYGKIPYHMAFYGHVNVHNQKRKVYLGFSFRNVFLRLDGKKASLFGPFE